MHITDPEVWPTRTKLTAVLLFAFLLGASASAQAPAAAPSNPTAYSLGFLDPLPQDTGASGLKLELRKLQTTGRLMMVVAHPDDEDGGLLTYEARGKGVQTLLMTLTRGEGGQNKTGDTFSDELGILRTLELLAADRYYGVEQRFSRVADFGYSKTPEETFQKWGGHDVPLADIVRVIRQFRPDVLIARFSGTERDGHGHHQASAILTKEAFRAAADPNRFPEQIKEGLQPWQPKKLYIGNVCGFGASTCPDENYTVKINTGEEDPVLGMTYFQFAIEGLRHQESQGLGDLRFPPGPRYAFYKLEDSAGVPNTKDEKGHEKDLFDGIDTTPPGRIAELANEAEKDGASAEAVKPLSQLLGEVWRLANGNNLKRELSTWTEGGGWRPLAPPSSYAKAMGRTIADKLEQSELALRLALDLSVSVVTIDSLSAVSPGESVTGAIHVRNGSTHEVTIDSAYIDSDDWVSNDNLGETLLRSAKIGPSETYSKSFKWKVPSNYPATRAYWRRTDPQRQSVQSIDIPRFSTLPLSPPPFTVHVNYSIAGLSSPDLRHSTNPPPDPRGNPTNVLYMPGETQVPILVRVRDNGRAKLQTLAVVPAFSVAIEPGNQVIPVDTHSPVKVEVKVSSNVDGANGTLKLEAPTGWRVSPVEQKVSGLNRGQDKNFEFQVTTAALKQGDLKLHAVLQSDGKTYSEGYALVTREDLGAFYYFEPATQHESIVDVKIPKDLKVGYIMGAGDDIPTVLQQIGMNVTEIAADKIASTDLSQFGTIVLGVRAYDTHKELVTNNQKLLDFVSNGGTLIVQNNNSIGDFNSEHLTPYPAELSRARVSVEEAPVQILAPDNPIFHYPNEITQKDFDNWVQERGLYFMSSWDSKFTPLLSCHDPGEPDQKGGMLEAKYGKGTYIFTGYAFFRQLPAGVPGAVRLFVNLVSAGHEHQQ